MMDSTNKSKRIKFFLLEQQLPDAKVVKEEGVASAIVEDVVPVQAVDHVTQVALETCRCIHLQEYLPHILDLELCKAIHHPRGWVVANPVHSLHLASQLEDATPVAIHGKQPPILYGEEQQRTNALQTEGIVEYWCPLDGYSAVIHDDTAKEKMEHLPTLHNMNKQPPHPTTPSATPFVAAATSSPSKQQHHPQVLPATTSSSAAARVLPFSATSGATPVAAAPATDPQTSSKVQSTQALKPPAMDPPPSPSKPNPLAMVSSLPWTAAAATTENNKSPEKVASSTNATTSATTAMDAAPIRAVVTSAAMVAAPMSDAASMTSAQSQSSSSPYELTDHQFHHLRIEEDRIRLIRRSLSSHRLSKKRIDSKKKRKREPDTHKNPGIPGWRAWAPKELDSEQEEQWKGAIVAARNQVEGWMDQFRHCRESYWEEQSAPPKEEVAGSFYLPTDPMAHVRCCQECQSRPQGDKYWDGSAAKKKSGKPRRRFAGDELMQCLECSFIGCSPASMAPDSKQHILKHLLISGHKFAVSCGERAQLFCFRCGDIVYHDLFQQEKERIDFTKQVDFMAWKQHNVQRSFDPFQFIKTRDHGIVWRGLIATYPPLVSKEHFSATQLTSRRQALFEGHIKQKWLLTKPHALAFAASQSLLDEAEKSIIAAPVGMYNLGNTCFKSAILQCLVHCKPLQRYFLKDAGHHHQSCKIYRQKDAAAKKKKKKSAQKESVCLACEMDRLFLAYYGSTIGKDVLSAVEDASRPLLTDKNDDGDYEPNLVEKGDPLIISDMLTSSWKSGGMDHLAGYDQRDAHEFLNSFLDLMGKHTRQHRERVHESINIVRDDNSIVPGKDETENDIVKQLFEGSLRSVLVCEECGGKRMMQEPFMNISLTLSEEVERLQAESDPSKKQISVETCLEHFILPEKLGDPVHCPSCSKKTPTKKQHTFSCLPKVLCLHLKRFDAARNRKIDEFVSFPARGLNMGTLLSHWCEVPKVGASSMDGPQIAEPKIMYDLFGTANHIGNMQSGHYITNVKVEDQWYHCNDSHIGRAGVDDGEEAVLKNEGAYILFYIRR